MNTVTSNNLMLFGAILIVLALIVMTHATGTILFFTYIFGAYAMVRGIVSLTQDNAPGQKTGWRVAGAIIMMLAGLVVFINPLFAGVLTAVYFSYCLVIAFIIDSFLLWEESKTMAIFSFIFAVMILAFPLMSAVIAVWINGGTLLLAGLCLMCFSKDVEKSINEAM